jgi:hypothetical protein
LGYDFGFKSKAVLLLTHLFLQKRTVFMTRDFENRGMNSLENAKIKLSNWNDLFCLCELFGNQMTD